MKFEERKVKTSTSGNLTRATKGLRSKKNPTLRYIYNPKDQNSFLLDSTTAAKNDQAVGAPKVGEGSDYQLVTPSMRLYLPRVKARLRGITALKEMSQVR